METLEAGGTVSIVGRYSPRRYVHMHHSTQINNSSFFFFFQKKLSPIPVLEPTKLFLLLFVFHFLAVLPSKNRIICFNKISFKKATSVFNFCCFDMHKRN